jgi:hypothetical protein
VAVGFPAGVPPPLEIALLRQGYGGQGVGDKAVVRRATSPSIAPSRFRR